MQTTGTTSLGVEFTVLRDKWNHILRRDKTPLSRAQEEVLAKARQSPAMVGVGVMRAPEAAVAEYALTPGVRTTAPPTS